MFSHPYSQPCRSYSQKVALGFELSSYLLLPFVVLSLIGPIIGVVVGFGRRDFSAAALCLAPFVPAVIGFVLLIGYYRHTRGRLSDRATRVLWEATFAFNALLLAPWIVYLFWNPENAGYDMPLFFPFTTGYLVALTFSAQAYLYERRRLSA